MRGEPRSQVGGGSEPAWKASKLAKGVGADWEGLNVR